MPRAVSPSRISARPWPSRASVVEVRVAEALADRRGLGEGGVRPRRVARRGRAIADRQEQVAPLDAVAAAVVEQPPGAGEPAAAARQLAAAKQAEGQPERAPRGPRLSPRARQPGGRGPRSGALGVPADE